jgi:hypothetical protein
MLFAHGEKAAPDGRRGGIARRHRAHPQLAIGGADRCQDDALALQAGRMRMGLQFAAARSRSHGIPAPAAAEPAATTQHAVDWDDQAG